MEKNEEITLSEAKKITGELKASILKLEALNSGVIANMQELKNLNQKLEAYSSILRKFEPKNEKEMVQAYSHYLSFLAQKIEDLSKNQDLKKLEKIMDISERIINLSVIKVAVIVAVVTTGINFIIFK